MRAGIVLISHDRRLLETPLAQRPCGSTAASPARSIRVSPAFEAWRDAILEQEESEQHKLGRKIAMEEDWLRYGVTARRTRNQRRLAELHALRRKRTRAPAARPARCGWRRRRPICRAGWSRWRRASRKSYGGRPIVRNFSTRIMRGDRVGIVGPNGAGKTTLLNLLTGVLAARCRRGAARHQSGAGRRSISAARAWTRSRRWRRR